MGRRSPRTILALLRGHCRRAGLRCNHSPSHRCAMGPSLSLRERGFTALYPRRSRNRTQRNQPLADFPRLRMIRAQIRPTLVPPRRGERAHGQRPSWRRGAVERGQVRGGYSDGPGMSLLGSPARRRRGWRQKGMSWPGVARPLRPLEPAGNSKLRVPVRPQQGHPTGRWRITIARSVRASSKRYSFIFSGRCPALRIPFHHLQRETA